MSHEQLEAIRQKAHVDPAIVRGVLARVPPCWKMQCHQEQAAIFWCSGIQVILSVVKYEDDRIWLHVSLCGRTGPGDYHLPSWEDVKRVKNDFIGSDRWAYQVFPNEREYINQNPHVLHLYALLEGEPALPDFTWGLGVI